jgi:hypothetical protein
MQAPCGGDPNWDELCPYKEKISSLVAQQRIRLVLDLHGAAERRPFDVDVGTMHGRSILGSAEAIPVLRACFEAAGFRTITENVFSAERSHTITRFCATKLGIPAIQLEVNRRFRDPEHDPRSWAMLLRALTSALHACAALGSGAT